MIRLLKSVALLWGMIGISLFYSAGVPGAVAQASDVDIDITELNALGFPENVQITAIVRDGRGLVVRDLDQDAFTVTEQGRAVDDLTIAQEPAINEIIFILDVSEALNQQISDAISNSNREFFTQLFSHDEVLAAPVFFQATIMIPGDNDKALQQFKEITDAEGVNKAIANGTTPGNRPTGKTKLFEAVETAIQSQPAHLVVLSDGTDVAGTPEKVSQLVDEAQTNGVTVHALEHRRNAADAPPTPLGQLAAATSGTYLQNPDPAAITTLVEVIRSQAAPSSYVLNYHSPLPEHDAQIRTVILSVHLATGGSGIVQTTYTALPADWDEATPDEILIEASGYPTMTLELRPLNRVYRRPHPPVLRATVSLTIGDQVISDTLRLTEHPRLADPYDEPAADNIALVVDLAGANVTTRTALVEAFVRDLDAIREKTGIASRLALFVPGKPSNTTETFTDDHGGLLNQSLRNVDFLAVPEELPDAEVLLTTEVLLATIERAIERTDTARQEYQRPGHVIVFTDLPLSLGVCEAVLTQARQHGVAVHIVQLTPPATATPQALTSSTHGLHLVNPTPEQWQELVNVIAAARPTFYTATFTSPLIGDGASYPLQVSLNGVAQQVDVAAVVAGSSLAHSRLPPFALLPIWIGVTLLIGYLGTHGSGGHVGQQLVNTAASSSKPRPDLKVGIDTLLAGIIPRFPGKATTGEGPAVRALDAPLQPAADSPPEIMEQPPVPSTHNAMSPEQLQRQQTLQALEEQGRQLARRSSPTGDAIPASENEPLNPLHDHDDYWD